MTSDPTPIKSTREQRYERVVRAAIELASAGGYEAVQMRDVATQSAVALGTIYRYFSSKDHLLAAALVVLTDDLEITLARRPPKGDTVAERVSDVLRRASSSMNKNHKLTQALIIAISSPDKGAASCQSDVSDSMRRVMDRAMPEDFPTEDRENVFRVLTFVWYGALLGKANNWVGTEDVGAEVTNAAHLLLDQFA